MKYKIGDKIKMFSKTNDDTTVLEGEIATITNIEQHRPDIHMNEYINLYMLRFEGSSVDSYYNKLLWTDRYFIKYNEDYYEIQ